VVEEDTINDQRSAKHRQTSEGCGGEPFLG
jgi:hypothetical protein